MAVFLRDESMTRCRAMAKSQVSKRDLPLYWLPRSEHSHPCFLEEVLGAPTVSGEIDQVAKQTVLIDLNEVVEQVRVAAP